MSDDIHDKIQQAYRKKLEQGKIKQSTVTYIEGGVKLSYGLARGAVAVAAILGHGLAGFALKRPLTRAAGGKMIKAGFEAAGKHIEDGIKTLDQAENQRRKK